MVRWGFHALWLGVLIVASACGSGSDGGFTRHGTGGASGASGSNGAGGSAGGKSSGGAAGGATTPCDSDKDCVPLGKLCDRSSGRCEECLVDADCSGGGETCQGGVCALPVPCKNSIDCVRASAGRVICNKATSSCVECAADADCDPGAICQATRCRSQGGTGGVPGTGGVGNGGVGNGGAANGGVGNGGVANGGSSGAGGGTTGGSGNGGAPPGNCTNNIVDGNETDVDCGGAGTCARCAVGKVCIGFSDCDSLSCVSGRCVPPTCDDGLVNGTEPVLDCGGPCLTCPVGGLCQAPANCASGLCNVNSQCDPAATCSNGVRDGTETDVDCGGKSCPRCKPGLSCTVPGDCLTRVCTAGRCAPCSPRLCPDTGLGPACCTADSCGYEVLGLVVCIPRS